MPAVSVSFHKHSGPCPSWDKLSINPKNWNLTAQKVAQMAAFVLAICANVLGVSAFMIFYPRASGICLGGFTLVGIAAFIVMILALIKHCQGQPIQT